MKFAVILRELRKKSGQGIKRLAPELGVNYTYLSKLENDEIGPSEELVERISAYFNYDKNRLLLSAGKVPAEIIAILREHPEEAITLLKNRFGDSDDRPKP
jgi:transcriptional regulator with XRE-family HTH domain